MQKINKKTSLLTGIILFVAAFLFKVISTTMENITPYVGKSKTIVDYDALDSIQNFIGIFSTIIPVLLLFSFLALFFAFKEDRRFKGKWATFVLFTFFASILPSVSEIINIIFNSERSFSFFSLLLNIFSAAAFVLMFIALLNEKNKILLPIGFGLLILSTILSGLVFKLGSSFIELIVYVLLIIISTGACTSKVLRNIAVILLVVLCFGASDIYYFLQFIAFIALAYLLVPGKFKIGFSLLYVALYALIAIAAITSLPEFGFNGFNYLPAAVLAIIGSIILAVAFLIHKIFKKAAFIGFSVLFVSFVMSVLAGASFSVLPFNYEWAIAPALYAISMVLLIVANSKENPTDYPGIRTAVLILAAVGLLFSYAMAIDYYRSSYLIVTGIAIILTSIYLIPFTYRKYQSIGKHIFLSIITLGIWYLIWLFNVTKNMNEVEDMPKRKPLLEMLLYLLLPLYHVFWTYKTAHYVDKYAKDNGKESNLTVLTLVISLFIPFVSSILIQNKINEVVGE